MGGEKDPIRYQTRLPILFPAHYRGLDITLFKQLINVFRRHIIQIPMFTDIVSITGMVFISRV